MVEALRRDARARGGRQGDPAHALLLTLALLRQAPAAPDLRTVEVGEVTVVAAPAQLDLGIHLAEEAARPREWLGLGARAPGPFRLVLVADEAALRRVSRGRAPTWGAAVTFPRARLVILRADADPAKTLRHELAHLILHEAVPGTRPLWFDEGYAVLASGDWDLLDRLSLNLAVATGATPTLDALNSALRGSAVEVDAAYALAATAVLEAARRNPSGSLAPLLGLLQRGVPFDSAVQRTTGSDLVKFGEEWRVRVRRRYGLFTWLAAGGLWLLVAGAVVVLGLWRRRRDAPRRAALDIGWVVPEDPEGPEEAAGPPPDALDPPGPRG